MIIVYDKKEAVIVDLVIPGVSRVVDQLCSGLLTACVPWQLFLPASDELLVTSLLLLL